MPFQQMAELQDRGLVGLRLTTKIDADELAHRQRFIQCFLGRRIRQVEPVLQEIQPQHAFQADRRTAVAVLRVERLDLGAQTTPGHHPIHLSQERGTAGFACGACRNSLSPASAASPPSQ
jgi:hypothetical protein